ncbi:E3 ubiquitin-protein ligase [Nymphaea thermarum]|nr:E3 ubiquitin-protein ligase [Nymphaea thermarum]
MDIDSPPPEHSVPSSTDLIVRRLALFGVPKDLQDLLQPGLINFALKNKSQIPQLVSAVLPTSREISELYSVVKTHEHPADIIKKIIKEQYHESMLWLQWLMFKGEPRELLDDLARNNNHHGVCGTIWGNNDIAYRCRTCEHDPTCAICVPCFQNGNHKDHDYSVIKTGGGCCDCGDATAWKRQGFCSRHGGPEQVQALSEDISRSVGPVLLTLLLIWKDKLLHLEAGLLKNVEEEELKVDVELSKGFSSAIIDMLMEFCRCSESLLRFIATSLLSAPHALLDVIVRAERFLPKHDANKLHELILKLLGEPRFKYEFAKVFIRSHADIVNEAIKRSGEGNNLDIPENMVLSSFSVQIFTVPTLAPRLVKENNLLGILLGCLEELLIFCINVNRWHSVYDLVFRLVEDIRFVMGHREVPRFVCVERQDICRSWIRILSLVQGMDPQRRATGLHVEEENESWHASLILEQLMGNIHLLLVAGAFSSAAFDEMKDESLFYTGFTDIEGDGLRHAKVGRLSEDNSGHVPMESKQGITASVAHHSWNIDHLLGPSAVAWLMVECLLAIDKWLGSPNRLRSQLLATSTGAPAGDLPLRRSARSRVRNRGVMSLFQLTSLNSQAPSTSTSRQRSGSSGYGDADGGSRTTMMGSDCVMNNTSCGHGSSSREVQADGSNFAKDGTNFESRVETLSILSLREWSDISFDVGSDDISIHLPLHRLISLVLHKTIEKYHQEHEMFENKGTSSSQSKRSQNFFGLLLGGCHPCGFSTFMMEHPLRVRVFCAQVRGGMWRRNGHSVLSLCENYHNVRWCEQGLDLDLFMLQFCAALAPPEAFVRRIVERFGLVNYISLDSRRSNEYESALVQDMIILIIQIVKERQLCGLSAADKLKRELIYRLVIGDATHSQLIKALPRSLSESDQLQNTIDMVAVYSNPSGMKPGRYSLRRTYWKELDLYHPRWNSKDLQLAEERYLRFCNVPAMTAQLPRWTKVFHPLDGLFQVAVSRTVLEIIRAVVYYAVAAEKSSSSRAPDGVLLRALHLISLALDICMAHCQENSSSSDISGSTSPSGSTSSSAHLSNDEEVILPLLAYAREVVVVDWSDANFAPGHQSLLSLLVLLMRKCRKDYEVNELGTFESGFANIATLIESLLLKFAELDAGCRNELEKIVPDMILHLPGKLQKFGGDPYVLASDAAKKKAKARERQAVIMVGCSCPASS